MQAVVGMAGTADTHCSICQLPSGGVLVWKVSAAGAAAAVPWPSEVFQWWPEGFGEQLLQSVRGLFGECIESAQTRATHYCCSQNVCCRTPCIHHDML